MKLNGARLTTEQFGRLLGAMSLTVGAEAFKDIELIDVDAEGFLRQSAGPECFELAYSGKHPDHWPMVIHDTDQLGKKTFRFKDVKNHCLHYANHEAFEKFRAVDSEFCTFCRRVDRHRTTFAGHTICRECLSSTDYTIRLAIASLRG